jgi:hypothetical protein
MLRVPPFRGDQVAAGVVVLTVLVLLLQVRMGWPDGGAFALAAVATAGVGVLVAGCPREPRPYVSAIVVSALVLLAVTLLRLGDLLGAGGVLGGAGGMTWKLTVLGLAGAGLARAYDAAAATLVAALALAFVPLAFVGWLADPSAGVQRLLLLLMAVGLALAAVTRRDRRPEHAAQLANAGGLALAAIAVGPLVQQVALVLGRAGGASRADAQAFVCGFGNSAAVQELGRVGCGSSLGRIAWGWGLPLLVGGFGLLAYGAVDRQRGPVLVGLLVLAGFVASASGVGRGSLLGWPIVLAVAAAFMLVVGLRPTTPAPPEPALGDEPPPVLPLSGPRRTDPR